MSRRIGFVGGCLVSLASLLAAPAHILAQPADPPVAAEPLPEPGSDALPSETPPPPVVPPEPPPAVLSPDKQMYPLPQRPPRVDQDGPPPAIDLMLPFGASSAILGGALLLSGGITLAAAPGAEDYCTVSGCVARERSRAFENVGVDLLGAGAGFAFVGGIGLLAWADSRPQGGERRHSVPLMSTGFSMTAFGAAGLGLGLGQTLTYKRDELDFSTSLPLFFTSGLLLAAGIPLWTMGANNRDAPERAARAERERRIADPLIPKRRKSAGRVVAGSILTGLGGLGGLAGTIVLIADGAAGGPSFVSAIIAGPALGAGALFAGIGVPLILSGNTIVIEDEETADKLVPEVSVGASGLGATWRLD